VTEAVSYILMSIPALIIVAMAARAGIDRRSRG
jgi:hypothetical protein